VFLGLEIKTWLGLSVLGAIISTIGAIFGILLKEYFLSRSLEKWRQKQNLEKIYEKFRDPLILSGHELASRTLEIITHYPTVYLRRDVFNSNPKKQIKNSIDDPYFKRYKLISTLYRMGSFLGWLELYRQEITFLRSSNSKHTIQLERAVDRIRSDLADGQLNQNEDWQLWKDTLVFREELRAIGESLIESKGSTRTVIGYGRFCEHLDENDSNNVKHWLSVLLNFYLDLDENNKDFRKIRLERIFVHIIDLLLLLDRNSIDQRLINEYENRKPNI